MLSPLLQFFLLAGNLATDAAPPEGPEGPQAPAPARDGAIAPVDVSATRTATTTATDAGPSDYRLPFDSEPLGLSDALKRALDENLDLRSRVLDVEVSETQALSALGAYDVRIIAGVRGSFSRQTPRGSAFVLSTGSETISGYTGVSRQLETGGNVSLRVDFQRSLTDQPISFFNPTLGSARLAEYTFTPQLTITHPLLRGLGIKVNRASLERARLATSQAQANEMQVAQDMVRDVVSAYFDVLAAERDLDNKHKSVRLAEEQLDRTRAQVRFGRLAEVELKAVEQSLATRESEVLVAENTLLQSSLSLRSFMGEDLAEARALGVEPTTRPEAFQARAVDVQDEISRALERNPQIRQLSLALASKRIDELEAANQKLPQLDFTGTFSPRGRSVDAAPDANTGAGGVQGSWAQAFRNFVNEDVARDGLLADFTVAGQLDLTWDVQNRAAKGNYARVQAELRQAEVNLKRTKQTVASSVITAANNLRSSAKRVDVSDVSVELAEENLSAEQARFDAGRSTNYDVLQRIDELDRARQDALTARLDYVKALVQLQALNGEILPAFGLELSPTAGR